MKTQAILPDDDELITQLLAKDENTYNLVVNTYFGLMKIVASSIVGDAISEEVVQEAWIAVIQSLPKFERRSSFKTWLLKIVSNCAKSRLRRESRKISCAEPYQYALNSSYSEHFDATCSRNESCDWHYDTPVAILTKEELNSCIHQSIGSLPALKKAVLTLTDIQGLDNKTVCELLEINHSNSRVLLHRARKILYDSINLYQQSKTL